MNNEITLTEIVLPNDTNPLGILLGGKLLHWMDIAAVICAQNHAKDIVVTAAVFNVSFLLPIKLADVVLVKANITRVFKTSLEIKVEVSKKELKQIEYNKAAEAYFTFTLVSKELQLKAIKPNNKTDFDLALVRRKINKVLSGSNKKEYKKLMQLINNNF